jgi:hypothetical protein
MVRTALTLVLVLAMATPAMAKRHHLAQAQQQRTFRGQPCLKYLVMYAPECPYIKGFCHGDFQMCDNQGGI